MQVQGVNEILDSASHSQNLARRHEHRLHAVARAVGAGVGRRWRADDSEASGAPAEVVDLVVLED